MNTAYPAGNLTLASRKKASGYRGCRKLTLDGETGDVIAQCALHLMKDNLPCRSWRDDDQGRHYHRVGCHTGLVEVGAHQRVCRPKAIQR